MRNSKIRHDPNTHFNPRFKEEGRLCGYEHCIESMPFSGGGLDCPVFGHDCPGGSQQAEVCRRQKESVRALPTALDARIEEISFQARQFACTPQERDRLKLRAALEALRGVESRISPPALGEAIRGVLVILEEILRAPEGQD